MQSELRLPLFNCYPGDLGRRPIRLAETKRPQPANSAAYPTHKWFTVADLLTALRRRRPPTARLRSRLINDNTLGAPRSFAPSMDGWGAMRERMIEPGFRQLAHAPDKLGD